MGAWAGHGPRAIAGQQICAGSLSVRRKKIVTILIRAMSPHPTDGNGGKFLDACPWVYPDEGSRGAGSAGPAGGDEDSLCGYQSPSPAGPRPLHDCSMAPPIVPPPRAHCGPGAIPAAAGQTKALKPQSSRAGDLHQQHEGSEEKEAEWGAVCGAAVLARAGDPVERQRPEHREPLGEARANTTARSGSRSHESPAASRRCWKHSRNGQRSRWLQWSLWAW